MRHISPLRYPGGKASIAGYLETIIDLNHLRGCSYFEPFAGGAGAALRLLMEGVVSDIHLNDLDPRIAAFWRSVLHEAERFQHAVMTIPLTLEEWERQKQICSNAEHEDQFELGFSTFYLNRCNRSGVLIGAAPIGGYEQRGKWRIDARFYRNSLVQRIHEISQMRERIHVTQLDAVEFLRTSIAVCGKRAHSFAYFDPPYHMDNNRLYFNTYVDCDHVALSKEIQSQNHLAWLMSYNNSTFIRHLYTDCVLSTIPVRYALQNKRVSHELMIAPSRLKIPATQNSNG